MDSKAAIIERLVNPGIIAVVRAQRTDQVPPLARALVEGGVIAIEVTLTTPDAFTAIRLTIQELGAKALVGVGTVLDAASCRKALEAGAQYVVSPIMRPELVAIAHDAGRPIMLGAYTPTEAQLAYEAGADFVKIFPADGLGCNYIKSLLAPLPHLKIVPTGGVDLGNAASFFQVGCPALGLGSSLVSKAILQNNDWPELTRLARAYTAIARGAKKR